MQNFSKNIFRLMCIFNYSESCEQLLFLTKPSVECLTLHSDCEIYHSVIVNMFLFKTLYKKSGKQAFKRGTFLSNLV